MKFWKLFAICPFWQRNRKTASTAPRTSLWRHSGRTPQRRIRAIPWRSAAFAPSTTPAPPHSAAPALFHTIAPVPLHDAGYASSRRTTPVPFRNAAPVPLHGAVPAPHHAAKSHAAHSTAPGPPRPPLGTAPELLEVWKQKCYQNCNFFAFGICRRCPNHGSSPENEAKRPLSASFPLYGRRERAANRKKVAKAPGFLFS